MPEVLSEAQDKQAFSFILEKPSIKTESILSTQAQFTSSEATTVSSGALFHLSHFTSETSCLPQSPFPCPYKHLLAPSSHIPMVLTEHLTSGMNQVIQCNTRTPADFCLHAKAKINYHQ